MLLRVVPKWLLDPSSPHLDLVKVYE